MFYACKDYTLFIHYAWSNLNCLHFGLIVNNVSMNIGIWDPAFQFFGQYTQKWNYFQFLIKLTNLIFLRNHHCFPLWLHSFTFPTVHKDSSFFTSSPTFPIFYLFHFFTVASLEHVKWYITVVCVTLVIIDV